MSELKQPDLSPQFAEYIGNANLKNPGAPTEIEQFYIQWALIEACCDHRETKIEPLDWIPEDARRNPMRQAMGNNAPGWQTFDCFCSKAQLKETH